MLIVRRYFLDEAERYRLEESVLDGNSRLSPNQVYKMDDKELISVYEASESKVVG
ncbi:hypothetical protein [Mesobacillus campisalis]|uniref:hypothetical protein n=1 Tax=Mesobacillus campisalis TaxID=1408103 RepID=UPI000A5B4BF8|nr:hypothetical protein [Mesobacillus campisalis]